MTIKIEVLGIKDSKIFLKRKQKEIGKKSEEGMKKGGLIVLREVKESILGRKGEPRSVDTSRFLNSVDMKHSKDNAVVFTKIPYSKFLEHGTTKIRERRHFQNSAARKKKEVKEELQKLINSI